MKDLIQILKTTMRRLLTSHLPNENAPGPDNIAKEELKSLEECEVEIITKLVNGIHNTEYGKSPCSIPLSMHVSRAVISRHTYLCTLGC